MKIDPISNGVVIDHIPAGGGMELYRLLKLDELDCGVAIIQNAHSRKTGKKDIIKIDGQTEVDLNLVGYVAPDARISFIRDGIVAEKREAQLPEVLTNVIHCGNPRCITTVEQELDQVFKLTDRKNKVYRCIYCETKAQG